MRYFKDSYGCCSCKPPETNNKHENVMNDYFHIDWFKEHEVLMIMLDCYGLIICEFVNILLEMKAC